MKPHSKHKPIVPGPSFSAGVHVAASTTTMTALIDTDRKRLDQLYHRISCFMMPTFVLVVFLNQIDRQNISFAALTMNRDLGFTASVYGLGSALFFIPMCLFQVPSNFVLLKVGVPRWLGFLVFSWGVVATCGVFLHDTTSFYVLRLLLGVFESGASPAMWYALSQFYPQERLTRPYMWLTFGVILSAMLGPPLAAGFLSMDGLQGLKGWQWLLLLEGLPSVLMGIALWFFLPETPENWSWLSREQQELFQADMQRSLASSPPRHALPKNPIKLLKPVLTNALLPLAIFAGFAISMAAFAFLFFSTILNAALLSGKGLTNISAAAAAGSLELKPILFAAIPSVVCAIVSILVAMHSQKRNEVYWHCSTCLFIAGAMFLVFPALSAVSVPAGFISMVVFAAAMGAGNGPLLSIVTRVCQGPSQSIGMPYYNSISILGGFVGPYLTGYLLQRPNGIKILCIVLGVVMLVGGAGIVLLKFLMLRRERRQAAAADSLPSVATNSTNSTSDDVTATVSGDTHLHAASSKDVEFGALLAPAAARKESGADLPHLGDADTHGVRDTLAQRRKQDANRFMPPMPH